MLEWGFLGEQVPTPLGDEDGSEHWYVSSSEAPADLIIAMYAGGARTRSTVEAAKLKDIAAVGGRLSDSDLRPTLAWSNVALAPSRVAWSKMSATMSG